ncbi:hypothetical protein WEH80_06745 [Actinomycetes bacterium KLBMP 9759]
MTLTPLRPQPGRAALRHADIASMECFLFTGLERFWPSRRGHAFDELCR